MNVHFATIGTLPRRGLNILLVFLLIGATGCSMTPEEPQSLEQQLTERGYVLGDPVERIQDYQINGWNDLGRERVIIHAGARDRYLLSFTNRCYELRSADRLAFTTTVNRVTRFDRIYVHSSSGFIETCWIETIHELERSPRPS